MAGKYTPHHPQLVDRPGTNWVDKAGGLPPAIDSVARALVAKGWTTQRAIATAVNHVKKVCATGRAFGGRTPVSAEARAKACAAAARWEAMKASTSIPSDERLAVELSNVVDLAGPSAASREKAADKGQALPGGRFPIRNREDLRKAILAYGRAKPADRDKVRRFIVKRARALDALSMLPDSWGVREMSLAETVELAASRGIVLELAGRQGLVPVKVTVRNRQGTTFQRTMYVRPGQAKAAAQKGGSEVTVKGRGVQRQERAVLEELAKIPRADRPAGWDEVVRQVASGPTHGGRLGPAKRKALRTLQANAPEGSPLKAAVTGLLKADAAPKAAVKKEAARKKAVRSRRKQKKMAGFTRAGGESTR